MIRVAPASFRLSRRRRYGNEEVREHGRSTPSSRFESRFEYQRLGAAHPSGQRASQRSRPDQRDHAGDGLHDRLGHLYCVRRDFSRGQLAGAADWRLADHRLSHHCRRAHLRRTGCHDAAGGRAVCLSARVARPTLGLSLRLDSVPCDSDGDNRCRRRGVRQIPRDLLAGNFLE